MLKKRKRKTKVVKLVGSIFFLAIMILILGTQIHGKIIYKGAAHIIHSRLNKASNSSNSDSIPRKEGNLDNIALDSLGSGNYPVREEEGILNFLFIGIEKMHGARNTDCMMLVTLDTKNKIFKLTSLMRDAFEDPKIYEGVTYSLVYNWEENVKQLYTFLYGDTEEEAIAQLKKLQ